jgi:hypothetical protein
LQNGSRVTPATEIIVDANVAQVEHSRRDLLATIGGDISPALSRSRPSHLEAL